MVEQPVTAKNKSTPKGTDASRAPGHVPPKRLPWLWTILLLLTLPVVGLGLWFGGTRHRVDDHPKKVKRIPRRLVPNGRLPMARPVSRPLETPLAPKGDRK